MADLAEDMVDPLGKPQSSAMRSVLACSCGKCYPPHLQETDSSTTGLVWALLDDLNCNIDLCLHVNLQKSTRNRTHARTHTHKHLALHCTTLHAPFITYTYYVNKCWYTSLRMTLDSRLWRSRCQYVVRNHHTARSQEVHFHGKFQILGSASQGDCSHAPLCWDPFLR